MTREKKLEISVLAGCLIFCILFALAMHGAQPLPQIIRINPGCFSVGTLQIVDVWGYNFTPAPTIYFNGVAQSTTVISSSHLQTRIIMGSAQTVVVTVKNKRGTSNADTFTATGVVDLGTVGQANQTIQPIQLQVNCPSWH